MAKPRFRIERTKTEPTLTPDQQSSIQIALNALSDVMHILSIAEARQNLTRLAEILMDAIGDTDRYFPQSTVTTGTPLPPARTIYEAGLRVAELLERDDLPSDLWNEIADHSNTIEDLLRPEENGRAETARFRGVLRAYFQASTGSPAPGERLPFSNYRPEIERRRAEYEKLAESLATIIDIKNGLCASILEGDDSSDGECAHLEQGVQTHLGNVELNLGLTNSAEAIRKFYAEVRLYIDERDYDFHHRTAKRAA